MAAIGARLEIDLGERRIDLLLQAPNLQQLPVHRVAKATGTLLSRQRRRRSTSNKQGS